MQLLKQSTGITVRIGPFVDVTDGFTPEEAVKVVRETKSNVAVAMHWGTIELSDEPPWEPPVRFKKAAQDNGLSFEQTWVMKIGETRIIPSNPENGETGY